MTIYSYDFKAVKDRISSHKSDLIQLDLSLDAALASCATTEEQLESMKFKLGLFEGLLSDTKRGEYISDSKFCEVEIRRLHASIEQNRSEITALKDQISASEPCQQKAQYRVTLKLLHDCKTLVSALQALHTNLTLYVQPFKETAVVRNDPRFEAENILSGLTVAALGSYVAYKGVRLFQASQPSDIETKSLSLCTMSLNALA